MLRKELRTHPLAYGVLAIGLGVGLTFFWLAWPNHGWQRLIGLGLSSFYLGWGTVFHLHHKQLTLNVFLEYLVFASLGTMMLLLITN